MSERYESVLARDITADDAAAHLAESVFLAGVARDLVDHQHYDRGAAWAALATMHAAIAGAMAGVNRVPESARAHCDAALPWVGGPSPIPIPGGPGTPTGASHRDG